MLGIRFFTELLEEPIFVYPVTSLAFGFALHLIGSIERLTSVVLEQLLNVLKWLAILAGLILALFTVALIFRTPRGCCGPGRRVCPGHLCTGLRLWAQIRRGVLDFKAARHVVGAVGFPLFDVDAGGQP